VAARGRDADNAVYTAKTLGNQYSIAAARKRRMRAKADRDGQ